MFSQTFTPTCQYFYTDISVISVTFRNSASKPYWAFGQLGNNESNVPYLKEAHLLINLLFAGETKSTCPLPCTTNVAETKLRFKKVSEAEGVYGFNWISLSLPDEVRVTETLFVETSVGQVLSDIGGTLGLWLGLGVLQLFQSFAAFKYNVAKKTSAMIVNHD